MTTKLLEEHIQSYFIVKKDYILYFITILIFITNIVIFIYILKFNIFINKIIPYSDKIESLIKVACDNIQC